LFNSVTLEDNRVPTKKYSFNMIGLSAKSGLLAFGVGDCIGALGVVTVLAQAVKANNEPMSRTAVILVIRISRLLLPGL